MGRQEDPGSGWSPSPFTPPAEAGPYLFTKLKADQILASFRRLSQLQREAALEPSPHRIVSAEAPFPAPALLSRSRTPSWSQGSSTVVLVMQCWVLSQTAAHILGGVLPGRHRPSGRGSENWVGREVQVSPKGPQAPRDTAGSGPHIHPEL